MVKCKDCGYLAVRDEYSDEICEATEFTRERGHHQSSMGNATVAKLLCFKDSPSFRAGHVFRANTRTAMGDLLEETNKQLNTEIECDLFQNWMPGRSPKEQEEMSFLEMIDSRTRQWHDEEVRRGQALEALYETRHQESRRDLAANMAAARRAAYIVSGIGLVASILAAILTVYLTALGK